MNLQLDANQKVTISLSGRSLVEVMNGLAELPWHRANPAMEEIKTQVAAALAPPAADPPTQTA